jgi:hypothetical protein
MEIVFARSYTCAYLATGEMVYKEIAKTSFDFIN